MHPLTQTCKGFLMWQKVKLKNYSGCGITLDIVCQGVECRGLPTIHSFSRNCGLAVSEKVNKATLAPKKNLKEILVLPQQQHWQPRSPNGRWPVFCVLSHLAPGSLLTTTADFVDLIGPVGLHLIFCPVFPPAEADTAVGISSVLPSWLSQPSSAQPVPMALSVTQDCFRRKPKLSVDHWNVSLLQSPKKAEDVNTIHLNGLCASHSTGASQS